MSNKQIKLISCVKKEIQLNLNVIEKDLGLQTRREISIQLEYRKHFKCHHFSNGVFWGFTNLINKL